MKSCIKFLLVTLVAFSLLPVWAQSFENLDFAKQRLLRYHDSGEYAYQIEQVEQRAQAYLAKRVFINSKAKEKRKLAIVFDVDETVLSNFPIIKSLNFGGTWPQFDKVRIKGQEPPVPNMLPLYKFAKAHGVTVFFITGRSSDLKQATEENLKRDGFTDWKQLFMMQELNYKNFTSAIPYKRSTRKKIEGMGYDIAVNIGDQYSDLTGGYADRNFKLPNPFYYIP